MKQLGLCKGIMRVVLCLIISTLIAVTITAQTSTNATLRGVVTDESGAVIPGAKVTLTNDATKDTRKTETNNAGVYVLSSVPSGTYKLEIEKDGFKKQSQTGLTLSPADTRGLDIVMTVGAQSETVTITAGNEALQTETGARENTITAKQIENLSIISRSSLELLRIMPGVAAPDAIDLESIGFGGGANSNNKYNVNGLRGENNNVTVDGARMMDIGANNGTVITANPDMIQEVKVQTSNYAAEHGTAAVMINAITKGGGTGYHGSLYDYSRDYRLGANDRSNTAPAEGPVIAKPASQYNYPGGNIGGPIPLSRFKDKLFFFTGFEYYYQKVDEGSLSPQFVPTDKMRTGDFSELLARGTKLKLPAGCNAPYDSVFDEDGNETKYIKNNDLRPCSDSTGLGKALLNLYPKSNYSSPTSDRNYVYSVLRPNNRYQWMGKFDYNISEKTKLYIRLAREHETQGFPRGLWWNSSTYEIPGNLQSDNLGRSVVVNLTNVINPTMTNEILFAASKLKLNYDYADPDKVSYESLGVKRVGPFESSNPYIPVGVQTWSGEGEFNTAYGYPIRAWNDSFSIADNLTKVFNSHTLKAGFVIEQANKKQQSNSDVNLIMTPWNSNGTGNLLGDLFIGYPTTFVSGTDRPGDNFRYYNFEFYGQDSWKVRPNLTFEYGLRVGYFPNNFERKGLGVLFDPAKYDHSQKLFINGDESKANGILSAMSGQIPKGVLPNNPPQLMPRLNIAWNVGGKDDLVIRAGAGLFYNRVQGNYDYYSSGQMPHTYRAQLDSSGDQNLTFANLGGINPFSAISLVNIFSRDIQSNNIPRTANMSLTIEKRMPFKNVLSVAYVGTQGRHLPQIIERNFAPIGSMLSNQGKDLKGSDLTNPVHRVALHDTAATLFRPYSAYNSIGMYQFTGTSTYHSLQATLKKDTGKLSYFMTYTFSKALGTTAINETDGTAWADPTDTRGKSWGVLPFDRTHIFNLSYNYNLPDFARGAIDKKIFRGILNGWQLSGITTFQSGVPIRIKFARDDGNIGSPDIARAWWGTDAFSNNGGNNFGSGGIAPIILKDPRINTNNQGEKIIDISAIGIPAFGESGAYVSPFIVRYPKRSNFDLSVFKNFKINESKSFQFRAGFFNIFNQAYPTRIDMNNPQNSDINLTLYTTCIAPIVKDVPNGIGGTADVCDPTKGFKFTDASIKNFGKIQTKRGRRIVELALKFYF